MIMSTTINGDLDRATAAAIQPNRAPAEASKYKSDTPIANSPTVLTPTNGGDSRHTFKGSCSPTRIARATGALNDSGDLRCGSTARNCQSANGPCRPANKLF